MAKAGAEQKEAPAFQCWQIKQVAGNRKYPVHVDIEPDQYFGKGRGTGAPIQLVPDCIPSRQGSLFRFRTGEMISGEKKPFVPRAFPYP